MASKEVYIYPKSCGQCDKSFMNVQLYGQCLTCKIHLCRTCYGVHLSETDHELTEELNYDTPEYCKTHNNSTIEYFCEKHSKLLCSVCLMEGTSMFDCSIQDISELGTDYIISKKWEEDRDKLNSKRDEAIKLLKQIKANKIESLENIRECHRQIAAVSDAFNEMVEAENKEFTEMKENTDQAAASAEAACQIAKTTIATMIADMQYEANLNHDRRLFIMIQKSKQNLLKLQDSLRSANPAAPVAKRPFMADPLLRFEVERSNIGDIVVQGDLKARWKLGRFATFNAPDITQDFRNKFVLK